MTSTIQRVQLWRLNGHRWWHGFMELGLGMSQWSMISLEDFQSLKETAYLLRSPDKARRLPASIARLEGGVSLGGWLAQDHLGDVECLGLFAMCACPVQVGVPRLLPHGARHDVRFLGPFRQ